MGKEIIFYIITYLIFQLGIRQMYLKNKNVYVRTSKNDVPFNSINNFLIG